jgi:LmbE family N-acetylglucosaminyl deacetylase
MRLFRSIAPLIAVALLATALSAQLRVQPVAEQPTEVALRLMLRKLTSVGTFMQTTAHPDDEDNGLLAMMGYGRGMRSVLVSATRGEGGQNEIGPELFMALSVLRTEELLAAHRIDGAEQYFTRAKDFGYSFSVEESLRKWGKDEIVGDFVRHIRTIRPDVIAGFLCDGTGGGQHHQASAAITREAFRAAADPARYPDQIKAGLRPWQARRLFCTDMSSFSASPGASSNPTTRIRDTFEPLLGRMYGQLGIEARSMHKCQGTSQLLPLPGAPVARTYRLQDAAIGEPGRAVGDLFEGIDTSLASLVAFPSGPRQLLADGVGRIAASVEAASRAVTAGDSALAAAPLAAGLGQVRALRTKLETLGLDEPARYEIDFRLEQKERQFEAALLLAHSIRLDTLADDGLVIEGEPVKVSILGATGSALPFTVDGLTLSGFEGAVPACTKSVAGGGSFSCEASVRIGHAPLSTPYWTPRADAERYDFKPNVPFGVPFTPTPFRAQLALTLSGQRITLDRPVEFRYGHIVAGEKRMDLKVVPPFAVTMSPEIAVIPAEAVRRADVSAARRVEVTVINHQRGPAAGNVEIHAMSGWKIVPERAPVSFQREDEEVTVAFTVTPPPAAPEDGYVLTAAVQGDQPGRVRSDRGYDVIEYPHIHRQHLVKPAASAMRVLDVTVAPNLRVGYVMGVGDQVPQAIEQLGAALTLIGPDDLAAGDLSVYDVIVTGVRAYERRADLRANNHRLLAYAERGGTVLVQYNKFEFNQAQYGPFPAKVGSDRVTDETAAVAVLTPDHPVFSQPNRIGPEAWQHWVQERGLYFLGDRDPRYADLVALEDPFELNPGRKTGALVEAKVGKGRWLYIGLGLWRQLPAGTPGAYRLLANLLSLGRSR